MLILIVVVVIAVIVLLHNAGFHRYMLATAEQKASSALGTKVQAREFALHLSATAPRLDLYDVSIAGAAPFTTPPLLQADHIGVGLGITSLLHRQWYLNDVQVDRPVARIFEDKLGRDNLPKTKSTGQSHTSVFDLGVRHAVLRQGTVYYNNRKSALDADLHDLEFLAGFSPGRRQYSGTLSYRDGHLQFGNYAPMPHNLTVRYAATPEEFTLRRAVLSSGPSQIALEGTVRNYSNPQVNATYDAMLDGGQFRRALRNPSVPEGVIRLAGRLRYQSVPNRPMLDSVSLDGTLGSRRLLVTTKTLRTAISDIAARYRLANGNFDVPDMRARLLGGELNGTLTVRDVTGTQVSRLRAAARGISLAALQPMVNSPSLRQVALGGTINAEADATWRKSFTDLVAAVNAALQAKIAPNQPGVVVTGAKNVFPVTGAIHARYAAATKRLALAQSYLTLPQTSVTLNGTVSNVSALQIRMHSNDLHELETVADAFRKPAPGQPVQPLGLFGTADFAGQVRGSTAAPQISGQLTAANLRVKGSAWRVLRANFFLSPSQATVRDGYLQPVDRGQIKFELSAGLRDWSFTNTSPFQARLDGSQLDLASLAKLAGIQKPLRGTLSTNIAVHGSEMNPVGQGTIQLTRAVFGVEPITVARLDFRGTGNQVHANLAARFAAGNIRAAGNWFPKQQGYDAQLRADGIQLQKLKTLQAMQVAGILSLDATGRGTIHDPGLQASMQIPQLQVEGQTISDMTLQANVANQVANVNLNSRFVNTELRARGTVHLTGNYETDAALDSQAIPLQPLIAIYAPTLAPNIGGETELHATLRGPLKERSKLDAHAIMPTLSVSYKNTVQIAAANPIRINYSRGVLALERTTIRGTGTDLQLQATVPTNSSAPASMLALGTVDLRLAQLVNPDISSSGLLRFNVNSYGTTANPNVRGQVQIVDANLATGDIPIGLQNGNGVLTLTQDRVEITRFQGTVGGGTLTAHGGVTYRPAPRFDLAVIANGIRLLYPAGVRETLDTDLTLTGTTEASLLRGQVQIEELQFTPEFDLMDLANQLGAQVTPPPSAGLTQNMQLDINVQSAGGLRAVSRTMSISGAANLNVQGTAADPVILGRVNLSSGDLIFMGNRYVVQGGTIDFANRSQTLPVVNMNVSTMIQQYNINMRFQGPANHLRTFYSSDPALPPADIIHLVAFGSTSEASAANPTPGNLAAESAIASQVSSQVTSRVDKIAGISQLSVDPVLGTNQGRNPGARVTIRQRVTSNLFVTFSTDVTSTQRETIEIQYQFSPRVSFSGTRDQNGGFGFDTRIRKTW